MIWYILKAYVEIKNEKYTSSMKDVSNLSKMTLGVLIISGLIFYYSIGFLKSYGVSLVSFLVMIGMMFLIKVYVQNENQMNHKENFIIYKNQVNDLRKLLKKDNYSLYSKGKLNYLIKKSDEELSNYKNQNNYFDKLLKFFSTIGMPIILLFFSIISKSLNWEDQIIILVAIISFFLFIYEIKKMIDEWLNRDFTNLEALKDNLESILIWDFL